MNVFTFFRKPYLSLLFAMLLLFFSCERNNLNNSNKNIVDNQENVLNYNVYDKFYNSINNNDIVYQFDYEVNNNLSNIKKILNDINNQYETNIVYPDEFLALFISSDPNYIFTKLIENGWINDNDIYLIEEIKSDMEKTNDFNIALKNYEKNVLNLQLNQTELEHKTLVANVLKAQFESNPDFEYIIYNDCFYATLGLLVAAASLASCATIVACGLAVTAYILATRNYYNNC